LLRLSRGARSPTAQERKDDSISKAWLGVRVRVRDELAFDVRARRHSTSGHLRKGRRGVHERWPNVRPTWHVFRADLYQGSARGAGHLRLPSLRSSGRGWFGRRCWRGWNRRYRGRRSDGRKGERRLAVHAVEVRRRRRRLQRSRCRRRARVGRPDVARRSGATRAGPPPVSSCFWVSGFETSCVSRDLTPGRARVRRDFHGAGRPRRS
jgi:hypothetical protein